MFHELYAMGWPWRKAFWYSAAQRALSAALACAVGDGLHATMVTVSRAVEHHHRMVAAVEDIDAVAAVDCDGGDVGELPAVRQLAPVLHHAIAMLALPKDRAHRTSSVGLEREALGREKRRP